MITAGTYGAPNWVDLSTPDIDAAVEFYGKLFDWDVETSESPMGIYHIGHVHGSQVAGMMQNAPDMGDMAVWTTFFYVEDVDKTVVRIEAAGGHILQAPFDIPEARISIAADPPGAMFGLISGPVIEGTWLSTDPGRVSWVETLSRDPAASEGFYSAVFDWKSETRDTGETRYTTFFLDDEPVAGMMMMPDAVPVEAPSHWSVYFTVAGVESAVKRLIQLGGKPLMPIMDIEMGRFTVAEDPQGGVFQLIEYES